MSFPIPIPCPSTSSAYYLFDCLGKNRRVNRKIGSIMKVGTIVVNLTAMEFNPVVYLSPGNQLLNPWATI